MSYTEINSVTVNKLTLEQYQALRANNALNADEIYNITDMTDYACYALRVGRVIPIGNFIFLCETPIDFTGVPLNTDLLRLVGSNNTNISLRLVQESGSYILGAYAGGNRIQTIGTGTSISQIIRSVQYIQPNSGYGLYARVDYIHSSVIDKIDSWARINYVF